MLDAKVTPQKQGVRLQPVFSKPLQEQSKHRDGIVA